MQLLDNTGSTAKPQPYRPLREHPRYRELKRIIEEMPAEEMQKLKRYIDKWLTNDSH
jgi:hypothetical protein